MQQGVNAQSTKPMAASSPTTPLTPISVAIRTLPLLFAFPELAAPVGLVVLPEVDDVAAPVLDAAMELVLVGTSSALRVPHWMQA